MRCRRHAFSEYDLMAMWTYILAAFFVAIGSLELLLAVYEPLRRAILANSPGLSHRAGPLVFAFAGCTALATGIGLLVYGSLW
jgi:hypothetical protein